jgi:hypothetical protein
VGRLSSLSRAIDLRYPSNRVAVAVAGLAAVAAYLLPLDARSLVRAGLVGVGAFLAWALGREIDPDRAATANAAAVAGAGLGVLLETPAAGALYLLVVTARVLARTTGLPPTTGDLVLNGALAAVFARTPAGWAAGMTLAYALVADVSLPRPAPRVELGWAAAIAAAVSVVAGVSGALGAWTVPSVGGWLLVAAGVAGTAVLARPEIPASRCDFTLERVDEARLRRARWVLPAALGLAAVAGGDGGVAPLAGGWAALALGGLVRLAAGARR